VKKRALSIGRVIAILICASPPLALLSAPVFAKMPHIDSSRWAVDPRTFGMSAGDYIQAESRAVFLDFLGRSGINRFFHFKGLSSVADK
jgi:hypothetical protein